MRPAAPRVWSKAARLAQLENGFVGARHAVPGRHAWQCVYQWAIVPVSGFKCSADRLRGAKNRRRARYIVPLQENGIPTAGRPLAAAADDAHEGIILGKFEPADRRRRAALDSLPVAHFVEQIVDVRQMVRGHVLNERAHEFVVADAAVEPSHEE